MDTDNDIDDGSDNGGKGCELRRAAEQSIGYGRSRGNAVTTGPHPLPAPMETRGHVRQEERTKKKEIAA